MNLLDAKKYGYLGQGEPYVCHSDFGHILSSGGGQTGERQTQNMFLFGLSVI